MELICPSCKNSNSKSQLNEIFNGYGKLGFLNNYIDEEGKCHYHDPNMTMTVYRCSSGHEIKAMKYNSCSVCKFNGGESRLVVVEDFLLSIL